MILSLQKISNSVKKLHKSFVSFLYFLLKIRIHIVFLHYFSLVLYIIFISDSAQNLNFYSLFTIYLLIIRRLYKKLIRVDYK